MPIKINFEGVSVNGFTPWELKVKHPFTIFNIEQKVGEESKEPFLKFEFKQVGGNRKAWRNFSLQPQSLWALKKLLVELGMDEGDLESNFNFEPADILGKPVWLKFTPEKEYEGKMRQEVSEVSGIDPE